MIRLHHCIIDHVSVNTKRGINGKCGREVLFCVQQTLFKKDNKGDDDKRLGN